MKKPTKKLTLNAETIRVMTNDHLQHAAGGSVIVNTRVTCACPVQGTTLTHTVTNGCTIGTSGTSVILPSGGGH